MECEICGKREAKFLVSVEGAQLNSCEICAKGTKILYSLKEEQIEEKREVKIVSKEETIVPNYGEIIKKAREALSLKIEDVAKNIGEKANYLQKIEREELKPSLETAKKLEKLLKVKLIETEINISSPQIPTKKQELTLLDVAEINIKEKKK